ncbi:hypothetical protein H0O02_03820 [Candidatus Micrarchaeota archaeon]|nr:hypothetical protein [Candidatus Micrarchaeota archaeon]
MREADAMDEKTAEQLKKPSSFPYSAGKVDFIETHISWIYLAGDYAYKVKRPVKFSFLDFSTFEKRKFFCEEEVRLNRRLCREMYMGVVPVVKRAGGVFFEGKGETIEYAVKMKRMPEERRMDRLLEKGAVGVADVEKLALSIAKFHERAFIIHDPAYGEPELIKEQIDDIKKHRAAIEKACGMGAKVDFALKKCDDFFKRNVPLLLRRQREGMIRDCHGDLHSANIFLADKVCIFDCIEFSKNFRYIDTASEIAFMAMDLDAFGKEDLSKAFVKRYLNLAGDREMLLLLNYYKCYRANVRAKIAAIEYSQKPNEDSKKRIAKYCELMEKYAKRL